MTIAHHHIHTDSGLMPLDAAEYIADLCEELCAVAERGGHRYLSYMLALTHHEARARAEADVTDTLRFAPAPAA